MLKEESIRKAYILRKFPLDRGGEEGIALVIREHVKKLTKHIFIHMYKKIALRELPLTALVGGGGRGSRP